MRYREPQNHDRVQSRTWRILAVIGILLIIAGLIAIVVGLGILNSEGRINSSYKRSITVSPNHIHRRSLMNGKEDITESELKPRSKIHSYYKGKRIKLHDIEDIYKNLTELSKNGTKHRWHKIEVHNKTHNGNKLEGYIHLMLKEDLDGPDTDPSIQDYGLNINCLPGYTAGVNLTVPGTGYMIDTSSITRLNPTYAVNVVNGVTQIWDSLGVLPVFGGEIPWNGNADPNSLPDGYNQVTYGSITPASVLAYTRVFGYFTSYPIAQRKIVEWDIVFGDASNNLCDAGQNSDCYHYPAIAMHEFGHALGLQDVYIQGCKPETVMYGYRSQGDIGTTLPQELDVMAYGYLYPSISVYVLTGVLDLPDDQSFTSKLEPNSLWIVAILLYFYLK